MKLETRYDVGYQFWVPRVINKYYKETVTVDGKEYTRDNAVLEIEARHKIVSRIEISITKLTQIKYYCVNYNKKDEWETIYYDSDMTFTDHESALAFARHWRMTEGTEYFGGSGADAEEGWNA